jgi:uncharacterized protein (AIM24 family)
LACIVWSSDNAKIESNSDNFWDNLFSTTKELVIVTNSHSSNDALVALSQQQSGKPLNIALGNTNGLYIFKEYFVATAADILVESKAIPIRANVALMYAPRSLSCSYYLSERTGSVFIQAGGIIMKKQLLSGETIRVNINCLIAFDGTCTISYILLHQSHQYLLQRDNLAFNITGPGCVYFSSCTSRRKYNVGSLGQRENADLPTAVSYFRIISAIISLMVLLFMMSKIVVEFEVIANNNLNNNRANNPPNNFNR